MDGGNKAKAAGGQPAAKGGKGKPAPAPDPYGKGPPTHQGAGGGGSSVWRDNLRCMWQSYNPEMPFNVWQHNLVVYSQQVTDLVLAKHDSPQAVICQVEGQGGPRTSVSAFGAGQPPFSVLVFCRLDSLAGQLCFF